MQPGTGIVDSAKEGVVWTNAWWVADWTGARRSRWPVPVDAQLLNLFQHLRINGTHWHLHRQHNDNIIIKNYSSDAACWIVDHTQNINRLLSEPPTYYNTWLKTVNSLQLPTVVSYDRRTSLRTYTRLGDRPFPVAGSRLWNSLPSNLRQSDLTLQQFRRVLKTYLCGWLSEWVEFNAPLDTIQVISEAELTETPAPSDFCL